MAKKDGSAIVGQRIVSVREDNQNVGDNVTVVELETGSVLFPVSRPDGQGGAGGLLYREEIDGPAVLLAPEGQGPKEEPTDEEKAFKAEAERRTGIMKQVTDLYTSDGGPARPFRGPLPNGEEFASRGMSVLDHAALEFAKVWARNYTEENLDELMKRAYVSGQSYLDYRAGEQDKPSREELVDALEDAALLISATNSALVDGPGDVRIRLYGPDKPSTTFMIEAQDVFKRAMDFVHRAKGEPQEETEG